jgi:nucleotide-binding universal stress UspA family protein
MYRAILVPLDGSAFGEQALPPACRLAKAANATLHLAHVDVIYPVLYVEGLPVIDAEVQSLSQAHARAYLDVDHRQSFDIQHRVDHINVCQM